MPEQATGRWYEEEYSPFVKSESASPRRDFQRAERNPFQPLLEQTSTKPVEPEAFDLDVVQDEEAAELERVPVDTEEALSVDESEEAVLPTEGVYVEGRETESSLLNGEAPSIEQPQYEEEAPYLDTEEEAAPPDLRRRIVEIANEELKKWDYGSKNEIDPDVTQLLQEYYLVGVEDNVPAGNLQDKLWQDEHPWSAVFISYVMKKAGAGDAFTSARGHHAYIAAAKEARLKQTASRFLAYGIREVAPEVGDLVCKDRKVCKERNVGKCIRWDCADTAYDNVDDRNQNGRTYRPSHSDIIVEKDEKGNRIRVVGGNVKNSVGHSWIALAPQGFLPERASDGCRYIALLKPPGVPAPVPTTAGVSAGLIFRLPQKLMDAVRGGLLTLHAAWAIMRGERSVSTLTDMIFYARHPERDPKQKIQPHERNLAKEWLRIRDQVIKLLDLRIKAM